MTPVQSSGAGNATSTAQPKRFLQVASAPSVLTRFEEKATLTENALTMEEYREIILLEEFLTTHVRPDALHDVQCMLLWSEWVRIFQRQTHRFPKVVLETEFREVVTNQLGINISRDELRGPVYPGLRFMP